jgi:hypothetical protein
LSRHGVEHEEDVRRLGLRRNPLELCHQLLVDVQAARGVEDHDVEAVLARLLQPEPRSGNRIGAIERVHGELDLLAELLELVDGRRSLEIAGDESGPLPVAPKHEAELGRRGRLARALETREENHGRRTAEREPRVARPHEGRQLLVDDLHDLLAGSQALQDVLAKRTLLDRRREVARHFEVDVRL